MLIRILGVLVIVTILCGTFFPHEVFAVDCEKAWDRCHDAQAAVWVVCGIAPLSLPCKLAVAYAVAVCGYAYYHCGG